MITAAMKNLDVSIRKQFYVHNNGCWVWKKTSSRHGYGSVWWKGESRRPGRIVYELLVGEVPLGMRLSPVCRNRACVNPDHMKPLSAEEITPRGDKSTSWKGDNIRYTSIHQWIRKLMGNPNKCESCNDTKGAKRFEWSNISHTYIRDISDWRQLCTKCHRQLDETAKKAWVTRRARL